MIRRIQTNTFNRILLIALALLALEVVISGGGFLVGIGIFAFVIFLGWKNYDSSFGKVVFWIGLLAQVLLFLSLFAVQFFIVAMLIVFFWQFRKRRKEPELVKPYYKNPEDSKHRLIEVRPLMEQRFIGSDRTSDAAYEWRDINIQGAVGDKVIDLSNTVVAYDAIVSVRHFLGNITIYVPYDVDVSIHTSLFFGKVTIFDELDRKLLNESVHYKTEGYADATQRIKIVLSSVSGDVEVRRR
ncbi:cell wall-active antibiotics response protein [Paenalkalicoccus suaedae]|uniref:Cell wall-active antibiotics response protein n=1 Tax=Paenalkalicoccus suaedae TaxID=2592382 RepID=A0A859FFI5_9BACI|nr:cell wall-active antibiotics response protein LiaF [Paenalkalicoccus suaedae]QKS71867.1 cell wall-active antibiotics response protein [Paenalkalicoccus suaedae]